MHAETAIHIVDTNIIPDRNAGIGSLLWDLQNPHDPDQDTPPLLGRQFAFIDVGVSRFQTAAALKSVLASDLEMDVMYVATERLTSVPYAHVHPIGDQGAQISGSLSRMISGQSMRREVTDWHYVVNCQGRVSSISYAYELLGNEVWESYFMGRSFLHQGDRIEFADPELDELFALEVPTIEALIALEMRRDNDSNQPEPCWREFTLKKNPLETGLAELGIRLQSTDVPQRIQGRQNVVFLGNVLNHYPEPEQNGELHRIVAHMAEGDIVVIQMDGIDTPFIEVLRVIKQDAPNRFERVRWINTKTLEVQLPGRNPGSWQKIQLKPTVDRLASFLIESSGMKASVQGRDQEFRKTLVRQTIAHVCATFFRAWPVEKTLRIAIREILCRLPSELGLHPLVSDEDISRLASRPALRDGDESFTRHPCPNLST